MTRKVTVHTSASCKLTPRAQALCQQLNEYRYTYPDATFKELAERFGLSVSNARRYYYGMHQKNDSGNWGRSGYNYNQVRLGVHVVL